MLYILDGVLKSKICATRQEIEKRIGRFFHNAKDRFGGAKRRRVEDQQMEISDEEQENQIPDIDADLTQ